MSQEFDKNAIPVAIRKEGRGSQGRTENDDQYNLFLQEVRGLTPRAGGTPFLILLNALALLAMLLQGVHPLAPTSRDLLAWGAGYGPLTTSGQWWRLVTATFLHIGIFHFLLNMLVLWDVGRFVERLVGLWGFLVVYLLAGFVGSLASVLWNPTVVSAGASGSVFGLFGLLLGFILRNRGSIPPDPRRRLQRSVGMFVILNLAFGLSVKGVDLAAHCGGLAMGLACGLAMAQPLTPEGVARRGRATLSVALGGAAMAVTWVAALPHHGPYAAEMGRFTEMEQETSRDFAACWRLHRQGALTDLELAKLLQERILPRWEQCHRSIQGLQDLSLEQARITSRLSPYMEAHEQCLGLLIQGLRSRDGGLTLKAFEQLVGVDCRVRENLGGVKNEPDPPRPKT
jgi:membrane associated rhomboid family serine protease